MKRLWLTASIAAVGVLAAAAITTWAQTAEPSSDPLFRAMRDEIERSKKLSIPGLESPYFIEYSIDEQESFTVSASLGGLLSQRRERFRSPDVHVRVGDYKFDNSNFAGGGGGGSRYDLERFPVEDSYALIRRYLWLETDSVYKGAVEALSRKRAALRNITQTDQLNDFAHAEAVHYIHDFKPLVVDETAWAGRVRSLSAIFAQFPEVKASTVDLEVTEGGHYLENSEGTEIKVPESVTVLKIRAAAQAPDGTTVRDFAFVHALDVKNMPGDAELTRTATSVAQNVAALAHAGKGEDYNGPVLFEGAAGAQLFAEVLGKNLVVSRRAEGGRGGRAPAGELEGRIGAKVLPESFDVVDDPGRKDAQGQPLFGSYDVDREGVRAGPLQVVEKGVLKSFLLTRQPVHGFEGSNGRARIPIGGGIDMAGVSNLIVNTSDAVPASDLKKKLLELISNRSKPYGILVRKMDFPSTASTEEAGRIIQAQQGATHPVSMPLLVYKVFADGHEELVRGLQFHGLNVRSLRDILASGNDRNVYEFMDNAAPFALVGYLSFSTEACVVAPSVLIDDLELRAAEGDQPKLPVVPAPEISH
jgi:predicted Zn-dependent protease